MSLQGQTLLEISLVRTFQMTVIILFCYFAKENMISMSAKKIVADFNNVMDYPSCKRV